MNTIYRRLSRFAQCLLMLLTVSGCRYTFELDDMNLKPMIAVKASICADSITVINIHKTIPVTEISKADTVLTAPFYTLKCNGKEVEASQTKIGEGGMQIQAPAFKSGDMLELTYGAERMETTVSKTVIPTAFPDYEIKYRTSADGIRTLTIDYEDNPDATDYYGIIVMWKGEEFTYGDSNGDGYYDDVVGTHERISSVTPVGDYDSISLDPGAYSPNVIYANSQYGYLFFWDDEQAEDNSYEVRFKYLFDHQTDVNIDTDNIELKCILYSFSEEMYRTLYAYFDVQYNPFASIGLSSPSFTYSNIRNGLGHFCGYTKTETEWFPATEEK